MTLMETLLKAYDTVLGILFIHVSLGKIIIHTRSISPAGTVLKKDVTALIRQWRGVALAVENALLLSFDFWKPPA